MSLVIQEARALDTAKDILVDIIYHCDDDSLVERARIALKHFPLAAAPRWAQYELSTTRYVSDHERKEIQDEYGI